jgi:DNA-binding Xre family transcriptional regulator
MKIVRSQFTLLLAQKEQSLGRRISLRSVARETGLNEYTVRGFANNTLSEYPARAIAGLCLYLNCKVGDLLVLEDASAAD